MLVSHMKCIIFFFILHVFNFILIINFIVCLLITRLCECGCLNHFVHYIDTVWLIVTVMSRCVCLCVHAYVVRNMQQHGERLIWKVMSVDGQTTAVKLEPECSFRGGEAPQWFSTQQSQMKAEKMDTTTTLTPHTHSMYAMCQYVLSVQEYIL